MAFAPPPVAVLDACVLYPAPIRDPPLHLASVGLYLPKWSALIHAEWTCNLLRNRPDLTATQLQRTRAAMEGAFPTTHVTQFEALVTTLHLPDPQDRHVLVAAIQARASVIVTSNLKDFPAHALAPHGVVVSHPDAFVAGLLDQQPQGGLQAFRAQVALLRNPPKAAGEVLDMLRKVGLPITADRLAALLVLDTIGLGE